MEYKFGYIALLSILFLFISPDKDQFLPDKNFIICQTDSLRPTEFDSVKMQIEKDFIKIDSAQKEIKQKTKKAKKEVQKIKANQSCCHFVPENGNN